MVKKLVRNTEEGFVSIWFDEGISLLKNNILYCKGKGYWGGRRTLESIILKTA